MGRRFDIPRISEIPGTRAVSVVHLSLIFYVVGEFGWVAFLFFLSAQTKRNKPVWISSVDFECGFSVWISGVDLQCGFLVWISGVDFLCGFTVWIFGVDFQRGFGAWISEGFVGPNLRCGFRRGFLRGFLRGFFGQ